METIIWPNAVDPKLFTVHAYNLQMSSKNPEEIWSLLIRAQDWPRIYNNCHNVKIIQNPGPNQSLGPGTQFTWETFGLKVWSEVIEYRPYESLGWTAKEILGWHGYHGWRLLPQDNQVLIVTEEVQTGFLDFLTKNFVKKNLERQHQNWLQGLSMAR